MIETILNNGDCTELLKDCPFKFDLILTDPPYNISKSNNFHTMHGNRHGIDFGEWDKNFDVTGWIKNAFNLLNSNGSMIVFASYRYVSHIIDEIERSGGVVKDCMLWQKSNPMPRNINRRYVQDNEFILWAVKSAKAKWTFNKDDSISYHRPFYQFPVVAGKERLGHPTQKPVALIEQLLKIHSNEQDWVLDCFMGVGSTGVACQNLKRNFVGIELEQIYYEIALQRLKDNYDKIFK